MRQPSWLMRMPKLADETRRDEFETGLLQKSKTAHVSPYFIATIYAGLHDNDRAFAFLEKAYQEKSTDMLWRGTSKRTCASTTCAPTPASRTSCAASSQTHQPPSSDPGLYPSPAEGRYSFSWVSTTRGISSLWMSDELGVTLLWTASDLRKKVETRYTLRNIRREGVDASLFSIPSGYKVSSSR